MDEEALQSFGQKANLYEFAIRINAVESRCLKENLMIKNWSSTLAILRKSFKRNTLRLAQVINQATGLKKDQSRLFMSQCYWRSLERFHSARIHNEELMVNSDPSSENRIHATHVQIISRATGLKKDQSGLFMSQCYRRSLGMFHVAWLKRRQQPFWSAAEANITPPRWGLLVREIGGI
jgi:hypothetical protein